MDFDLKGIGSDHRRSQERRKPQPTKGEFARHFQSAASDTHPEREHQQDEDREPPKTDEVQITGGLLSTSQILRIYVERMAQELRRFLSEHARDPINPADIALHTNPRDVTIESAAEDVARNAYRVFGLSRGNVSDAELSEDLRDALDRGVTQIDGILEGLSCLNDSNRALVRITHGRAKALLSSLPG